MKAEGQAAIKDPKAEIRRPKEGRDPKSELEPRRAGSDSAGGGGKWGDRICEEKSAFHEGGAVQRPSLQDLHERTAQFGEKIINFAKKIPQNPVNSRLITQLVGAGTSVGANYCEADDAISGKEFKQKIGTCRKESKETMFFLRMVASAEPDLAQEARKLWREAKELNLIFGAIWRK